MEAPNQFLRLFNFDMWANEQVLFTLQEHLPFEGSEECVTYFAHIAGTQELWYHRIKDTPLDALAVWPEYGLATAIQKLNTLSANWKRLIGGSNNDLDRIISYQNSKGISYDTMFSDILHHVIIHGQHHRAQIAKLIRNAKVTPLATDFIFFSRAN